MIRFDRNEQFCLSDFIGPYFFGNKFAQIGTEKSAKQEGARCDMDLNADSHRIMLLAIKATEQRQGMRFDLSWAFLCSEIFLRV